MLQPISTWFLAIETVMLQIISKVYQKALEELISLIYTIKYLPYLEKHLRPNSFVLHRTLEPVQFVDKLKPLRRGLFKRK